MSVCSTQAHGPRHRSAHTASTALTAILAGIVPCLAVSAQGHGFTSPRGFLEQDAPATSFGFGGLAEARYQFLDGELGDKHLNIKSVSVRLEGHEHYLGLGRSWGKVLLSVAPADFTKHSKMLDRNRTGEVRLVFFGKVSWPRVESPMPPRFPEPESSYTFPFSAPYAKEALQDLLLDFRFIGGVLHKSGAQWNGVEMYPLDAVNELDYSPGLTRFFGAQGCTDSAFHVPAFAEVRLRTYRNTAPDALLKGKVEVQLIAENVAPSAFMVQGVGVTLSNPVPVGPCQDLYLTQPLLLFPNQANAQGRASFALGRIAYQPDMQGFAFTSQGAFNDSKTGAFLLTMATSSTISEPPPDDYCYRRVSYTATSPAATEGVFQNRREQPVLIYGTDDPLPPSPRR